MRKAMPTLLRTSRLAALALLPAAGFLLIRPGAAVHAQNSAPAAAPETVSCASGFSQWLSAPRTVELSQGVQFGQDDAVLKTEAAVALLDKDQNLVSAQAQGPVHLYDTQDDLVGQHGSVDFTKHLATLQGSIVLVVKPGKQEADADENSLRREFKDPATLTCQMMTYDYKYKVGRIPGPLTVTQVIQTKEDGLQTRTLTADAGLYNGKAQTILLVGDIKIINPNFSGGSKVEGDTRQNGKPVLINLKKGSELLSVPFQTIGVFPLKPQPKGSDDPSPDDEPDLTLPVPPPHAPSLADASVPPTRTPASSAPAQAPPSQTPAVTASPAAVTPPAPGPALPAQTPPAAASSAGKP